MAKFICSFILLVSFISCQNTVPNSSNNTAPEITDNSSDDTKLLSFNTQKSTQKHGDCTGEAAACATVAVDVLVADGGKAGVAQTINETIKTFLVKTLDFGESEAAKNSNVDSAVANVIKEFNIYRKDSPNGYPVWEFTIGAAVGYQNDQLVSMQFDTYASTGGAHPNGWSNFLNFDVQTGKLLDQSDLIKDKKGLTALAEKKFRVYHELEPDDNLAEAGFEFQYLHTVGTEDAKDENRNIFALPKQIGIHKDKLILCYNAYEIAAYVVGPTVLEIPLTEVSMFLNML